MTGDFKERLATSLLFGHYISNNGKNLGMYRIEYKCGCGKLLKENGHSQDPFKASGAGALAAHRAEAIIDLMVELLATPKGHIPDEECCDQCEYRHELINKLKGERHV